jgi:endonuclease-8
MPEGPSIIILKELVESYKGKKILKVSGNIGSYSIDEQTKANPRLCLKFENGALYFYTCSVQMLETPLDVAYDWSADVMNDDWNPRKARKKELLL